MATGRTVNKWTRVYCDGYNLSGYGRTIGPLVWDYDTADLTCPMSDAVQGGLPNHAMVSPGTFEGVFDNTATSGLHAVMGTSQIERDLMVPIGIRAAPAAGDPVFAGSFTQLDYQTREDGGAIVVTIPFGAYDPTESMAYEKPWGNLLHALGAETAVNSSTADHDNAAQTTAGGWMMYQVTAGDGTATIKVQHSATDVDGDFADLAGATSGVIDCSAVQSGIAQCAVTATVERYTRWQIVLGTATTVTFALAFIRI